MILKPILLSFLTIFITITDSYRILGLFPHPAISHFLVFEPILKGLAEKGHHLTIFSYFPQKTNVSNYLDVRLPGNILTEGINFESEWFKNRRTYGYLTEFQMTYNWAEESCRGFYGTPEIQNILKSQEKYDVILMEQFVSDCFMGIAWKLDVPVIGLSSCPLLPWLYDRIGTPFIPSFMPSFFVGGFDQLTFYQRFRSMIDHHLSKLIQRTFHSKISEKVLQEQFGPDVPSVEELVKNTSLVLVNTHYSLSGSKPMSPALIEIGGIHLREPEKLETRIQEFLDNSTEGVIYVSWGSMVKADTMPKEKLNSLLRAFGSLKQKVLWKLESEINNLPNNIFIEKWLQQQEILCHPNVKVFVTHGGLLGSTEAAFCGTPVVVTPMFGDQFNNGAMMVSRGMGQIVHYEDINFETVTKAIHFGLLSKTQENAQRISYSFKNRINTPLETAIWWTEYVAKTHGAPLIKSYAVQLPWYVYHSVDVYIAIILITIGSLMSWIWLFKKCCCNSSGSNRKNSKEKMQ